ncbi:tetratricopeptide repeat protein [Thermophagus sp. OGC60D27]|uniref:tetratricopeptide repeat protein n=1 Tax=Thermophagus sp. OGC60D27 TaxID=3458415 RepID=UPI0040382574
MKIFPVLLVLLIFTQPTNAQQQSSEEIIEKGIKLHDEGKYQEAVQQYHQINENDSNYVWMLSELALTYLQMGKYDSAVVMADLGLTKPSVHKSHLFRTKATALDYAGKPSESIRVFKHAIEKYPFIYLLHFNLAITFLRQEQYADAIQALQEALRCNPFHASSHLQLGILMARQKQYTRAFLSLETFLALEPNSDRSNKTLVFLENIANNYLDTAYGQAIEPVLENRLFKETDHYLKSGMVLTPRFKSPVDFDASLAKQTKMLLDVLPFETNTDDFWAQLYFPFFKQVKEGEHLVPFLNTILISSGNDKIIKYHNKNRKELKEFFQTGQFLGKIKDFRKLNLEGEEKIYSCQYYDEGNIYSIGNFNQEKKEEGLWIYFHNNGEMMAKGVFVNGEKDGKWEYFYRNGQIKESETYQNGNLHGTYYSFHENGNKKLEVNYTNGNIIGDVKWFDPFGLISEQLAFKDNNYNGPVKIFYPNNGLKGKYINSNGSPDGEYQSFHPNGTLLSKQYFSEGQLSGEYLESFSNGKLSVRGHYDADNKTGEWRFYYPNGNIKTIENYQNGKPIGKFQQFYSNGQVEAEYHFNSEGELNGSYKYFTPKGDFYLEETYENGKLVAVSSFNRLGEIINKAGSPDGSFEVTLFGPDVRKLARGAYSNGKRTGKWVFFYKNGNVSQESIFNDGQIVGKQTVYFPNETIKAVYHYNNEGLLDGLYEEYYKNGNIKSRGYYKDGQQDGAWDNYRPTGELETENYFLKGVPFGWQNYYAVDGTLSTRIKNIDGRTFRIIEFDSNGNIISDNDFTRDSLFQIVNDHGTVIASAPITGGVIYGPMKWYGSRGNVIVAKNFYNDMAEGDLFRYYDNGQILTQGQYLSNNKIGKWVTYYETGEVEYVNHYLNDQKDSLCFEYYQNGNIREVAQYHSGILEGDVILFDESGEQMVKLIYSADELIAYQYMLNGTLCDTIKLTDGNQTVEAFYNNGQKSFEMQFQNYLPHGKKVKYYPNGQIASEYHYQNGLMEGECKEYFLDGTPKKVFTAKAGLYHGEFIEYYKNGKPKRETSYKADEIDGERVLYKKNGKVERIEIYRNGEFNGLKEL